jgi:hypothetical protein
MEINNNNSMPANFGSALAHADSAQLLATLAARLRTLADLAHRIWQRPVHLLPREDQEVFTELTGAIQRGQEAHTELACCVDSLSALASKEQKSIHRALRTMLEFTDTANETLADVDEAVASVGRPLSDPICGHHSIQRH